MKVNVSNNGVLIGDVASFAASLANAGNRTSAIACCLAAIEPYAGSSGLTSGQAEAREQAKDEHRPRMLTRRLICRRLTFRTNIP